MPNTKDSLMELADRLITAFFQEDDPALRRAKEGMRALSDHDRMELQEYADGMAQRWRKQPYQQGMAAIWEWVKREATKAC